MLTTGSVLGNEKEEEYKFNLEDHLLKQIQFSENTFGPGPRTEGVVDHIRQELDEVSDNPSDPEEWTDVILLALDGAWRNLVHNHGYSEDRASKAVCDWIKTKQRKNENRSWPNWETSDTSKAINHNG